MKRKEITRLGLKAWELGVRRSLLVRRVGRVLRVLLWHTLQAVVEVGAEDIDWAAITPALPDLEDKQVRAVAARVQRVPALGGKLVVVLEGGLALAKGVETVGGELIKVKWHLWRVPAEVRNGSEQQQGDQQPASEGGGREDVQGGAGGEEERA